MDNVASKMGSHLPPELLAFLRTAGEVAENQGQRLYLVGGAVRDLLLERPNLDFDLVVEGDAPLLARQLAKASGEKATVHRQFGTAKFHRGSLSIDLATARCETYSRPGALPDVTPGKILDDLLRRDFSINAMAIDLTHNSFGELLDAHGGINDLEQGLIRILHQRSFIDDATRILRALRYEQRLGFRLEESTEKLLRKHTSMLDTVSGDRIRHELELNLEEDHPERILHRAEALGVLKELHPSLRGDGWLAEKFELTSKLPSPDPTLYLLLLIYHLTEEENEQLIARLNIVGELRQNMRQVLQLKAMLHMLAEPDLPPSSIHRLLKHYSPTPITTSAVACDSDIARSRLQLYLNDLRYVKPSLDGESLKSLGLQPGPRMGRMLQSLLEAKLDGKVNTREDEEALVRQWLK